MLGRVSVNAVYQLMDEYGDRLLEKNIRRYLGKNVINEQIGNTLLSEDKRQNFFFPPHSIVPSLRKILTAI